MNALLVSYIDGEICTSDVSYSSSFSMFFESNTTYSQDIAILSSLLSANAYENIYLDFGTGYNITSNNSMEVWMNANYMEDYHCYDLNTSETDQHISKMFVAHKRMIMNGMVRNIVCVVIRGTNGNKEWQSNFDIGSTDETLRHEDWLDSNNHMGFDITANRLNEKLTEYINTYCPGSDNVFWITGHSRGGALANLLAAKLVDAGNTVFAYTFASPNTTTLSFSQMGNRYNCIFNIVNEDDYVTELPLEDWNFRRYGIDKIASVGDEYADEWERLTNYNGNILNGYAGSYSYDTTGKDIVLNTLIEIADNRNDCYSERPGSDGYHEIRKESQAGCTAAYLDMAEYFTDNMDGTYRTETGYDGNKYYCRIYQRPTFLMQILAAFMSGDLSEEGFLLINVAPYLESSKYAIILHGISGMIHPHCVESYYLLSTKLT